jgi:hypothetical protein
MKQRKKLNKIMVGISTLMLVALMSVSVANAASGSKTASNRASYYSWCGLHCFTMGVDGNYHSNGTKIDSYSTTKAVCSTSGTWSVCDKSAAWIYKGTTTGTCKAYATFKNGIITQWFQMAWETYDKSISAEAYR